MSQLALNSARDSSSSFGSLHHSVSAVSGRCLWAGLKLSGVGLHTCPVYHQATANSGPDYSSIYFVWLAATLEVITSGITQPRELRKPLPIARLWLFNISVHVPMKSSGWDAGLFIKSAQETMLLGKYIQP